MSEAMRLLVVLFVCLVLTPALAQDRDRTRDAQERAIMRECAKGLTWPPRGPPSKPVQVIIDPRTGRESVKIEIIRPTKQEELLARFLPC